VSTLFRILSIHHSQVIRRYVTYGVEKVSLNVKNKLRRKTRAHSIPERDSSPETVHTLDRATTVIGRFVVAIVIVVTVVIIIIIIVS
jgi:hypothetical protein